MSRHPREVNKRIDYRIFNSTGARVLIPQQPDLQSMDLTMDENGKKLKEIQIADDIDNLKETYPLDELDSSDDLEEYINFLHGYVTDYRHIHADLKMSLGADPYNLAYPNYGQQLEGLRGDLKLAKSKLKTLKNTESLKMKEEELERLKFENEQKLVSQMSSLKIREKVFRNKIISKIESIDYLDIDQIKEDVKVLNAYSSDYFDIQSEVEIIFGNSFDTEFGDTFKQTFTKIEESVKDGCEKLKILSEEYETALFDKKVNDDKKASQEFLNEQKFRALNLFKEIKLRCEAMLKRCDLKILESASDFQLLDIKKRFWDSDTEMYEILNKITEYSNIAVLCGEDKEDMLVAPHDLQKKALDARNTFCQNLHKIIEETGVDEDKLRRGNDAPVELAKFKGYDSKLDIYSFRAEFERLVQPTILKRYWVDTLKTKYLGGPALVLVEKTESIAEVWTKLIDAYGNVKLLLQNKLGTLDKFESLGKVKGDEKLGNAIAKIVNLMTELSSLSKKFDLEHKLYIGGGLEKVMSLLGNDRERKFMNVHLGLVAGRKAKSVNASNSPDSEGPSESEDLDFVTDSAPPSDTTSELEIEKQKWTDLKNFLYKELTFCEQMTLLEKSKVGLGISSEKKINDVRHAHSVTENGLIKCPLCGKNDHKISTTKMGKRCVDYVACKEFVKMTPLQRCMELKKHSLCFQCLTPGVKWNQEHKCYDRYVCPDQSHLSYPKGIHVLLCEDHKNKPENKKVLDDYIKNFISKRSDGFEKFTTDISLVCFTSSKELLVSKKIISDVNDSALFMLQTINVEDISLNIFYDSGCGDIVIKKSAVDALIRAGRAELQIPGPIPLKGVGDTVVWCEHGVYSIRLPLQSGKEAVLSGVCLDQVTSDFPYFDLDSIEKDLRDKYKDKFGKKVLKDLPRASKRVGGSTDILIGAKYFKYHPKLVFELDSGLSLLRSQFFSADGSTGVIGGPHPDVNRQLTKHNDHTGNPVYSAFFGSSVMIDWNLLQRLYDDAPIAKGDHVNEVACECFSDYLVKQFQAPARDYNVLISSRGPKSIKMFEKIENTGTEVSYRCPDCRNCPHCKKGPRI